MPDVQLFVNGKKHGGWKTVSVTRSMESIAGSFSLGITDRWTGQTEAWPIGEEDECRVELDGEGVIHGFVDTRSVSIADTAREITFAGRDKTAALVDCAAVLDRWSFKKVNAIAMAKKLAAPFGIHVDLQPGIILPPAAAKTSISPGDTAFEVLARVAAQAGLLAVNDGSSNILLTRAGTTKAAALVEGENVKSASVDYNAAERFRRYLLLTQKSGTDEAHGAVTRVRAEAFDLGVRRTDRVTVILPEQGMTADYARRRANWTANVRRGQAQAVNVTVQGWRQPGGDRAPIWPINALVDVQIPAIGVSGTMLITSVTFSLDDGGGSIATLKLVDPGAFEPEPTQSKKKPSGLWKELAGGAR